MDANYFKYSGSWRRRHTPCSLLCEDLKRISQRGVSTGPDNCTACLLSDTDNFVPSAIYTVPVVSHHTCMLLFRGHKELLSAIKIYNCGGKHSRTAIRFYEIHTPLTEAVLPDGINYKTILSLCYQFL
jgi:hypothetical protein